MNQQEVLRKVRALLNLADQSRGATPEEAASAAAKAQELMDKFSISTEDVDFDSNQKEADAEEIKDFTYDDPIERMETSHNKESEWSVRLASVVSQHNQCLTRYMKCGGRNGFSIRIIGRPSDVQLVRYLYSFFKIQIKDLQSKHTKGNSFAYKAQFCLGCIDMLSAKLAKSRQSTFEAQKQEQAHNPNALVRVNSAIARIEKRSQEVTAWFALNNKIKATTSGGFRGSNVPTGGRAAGQAAGQSIRMTGARANLGSGQKSLPGS